MTAAADILRSCHIRVTRSGEQVLELLQETNHPLTVEDIYFSLHEKDNKSNLSTIYRILERFVEKNLVNKYAYMDNGKSLYELTGEKHHHYFRCLRCGQLLTVDDCPLTAMVQQLSNELHIQITSHKLELSGYCEKCCSQR